MLKLRSTWSFLFAISGLFSLSDSALRSFPPPVMIPLLKLLTNYCLAFLFRHQANFL